MLDVKHQYRNRDSQVRIHAIYDEPTNAIVQYRMISMDVEKGAHAIIASLE
jgi:hypothetical protein